MTMPKAPSAPLEIWWIPQVHGKAFRVAVSDIEQAKFVFRLLTKYDLFQFTNRIKPDYSNASGLEVRAEDGSWEEWMDIDGNDIGDLMHDEDMPNVDSTTLHRRAKP